MTSWCAWYPIAVPGCLVWYEMGPSVRAQVIIGVADGRDVGHMNYELNVRLPEGVQSIGLHQGVDKWSRQALSWSSHCHKRTQGLPLPVG